MKTDDRNDNDVPLRALLKEWKQEASLPPRFQEQVWRRIERDESASASLISPAAGLVNRLANLLRRPALAAVCAAALVVIGAGAGWSQAQEETARISDELGARYAQAVDPYRTAPQP